ncbi:hypothetical protein HNR46_001400 [Haloferula luteola]|uniref:Uncharacterized protein n=1 Tax=Haloferula luteola TaxID=595692 RepID=A0A840V289_9BACT|nr:hypothetical protein [Haloferula luteola]MBB5351166.1 hypothetical protein [Haloferula luteola]
MKSKKPVGCWVVAGLSVALLVALVAGTIYGMMRMVEKGTQRLEQAKEAEASEAEPEKLEIPVDAAGELPDGQPWELSLESYLRFLNDSTLTSLARDAFEESAKGAQVEWRMQMVDVSESPQSLVAGMMVDYLRLPDEGQPRTTVHWAIPVLFDVAERAKLVKVSRGDWVHFRGTLQYRDHKWVVESARLVSDDE